jgi:hypothetical protein
VSEIKAFIEARFDELQPAAELAPSSPGVPVPTESPGRWRLGIAFGTVFDGETTVAKARSIPLAADRGPVRGRV